MESIHTLPVGPTKTNCYILNDGDNVCVIDPGAEGQKIIDVIKSISVRPYITILLTQGHADHIMAVDSIIKRYPKTLVYAGRAENLLLYDPAVNLSLYMGSPFTFTDISSNVRNISTGDEIPVGKLNFRVIDTPGHSPGSLIYVLDDEKVVFTGDTLMRDSLTPTNLPYGDSKRLAASIKGKVFSLPDNFEVYPGHGEKTTIEQEKTSNSFVRLLLEADAD